MIKVIKKDGSMVEFDGNKIKVAIRKSAERSMISLTEEQENKVVDLVYEGGSCI